jgi:hypothetical protein
MNHGSLCISRFVSGRGEVEQPGRQIRGRPMTARLQLLCVFLLVAAATTAHAQTFRLGDVSGYINLEASYGLRFRLEDQDKSILGVTNAEGATYGLNFDDGNLNYDEGEIVANLIRLKPEIALTWQNVGFFASGVAFYDYENSEEDRKHVQLSGEAENDVAHDADLKEAYFSVDFMIGDMPTRLRLGKQALNWGESSFYQGVSAINPVNLPLFSQPGATPQDLAIGQNMVWGLLQLTPLVSAEGFYQFGWEPTELHSSGTYFGTSDAIEGLDTYNGANFFQLPARSNDRGPTDPLVGLGSVLGLDLPDGTCENMNGGAGPQTFRCQTEALWGIPSFKAKDPDDKDGDWGITLRTIVPRLNDTKFALHYAKYTPHAPILSIRLPGYPSLGESGYVDPTFGDRMQTPYTPEGVSQIAEELVANGLCDPASCAGLAQAIAFHWILRDATVQLTYPDDKVDLFAFSWNTTTINTGTALGGELVYQKDLPMQIHPSQIIWALANPTVTEASCNTTGQAEINGETVPCAPSEFRTKYQPDWGLPLDTFLATFSGIQLLPPGVLGSSNMSVGFEVGWLHVFDLPDKAPGIDFCAARPDQRADPADVTLLAIPGTQFGECDPNQYAYGEEDSWGYAALAGATWNGVFGALNVSPRVVFKHDVDGYAPTAQFIEGRKQFSVGLRTGFLRSASIDISYTSFWGSGRNNLIRDRDYLDLVFKYEF